MFVPLLVGLVATGCKTDPEPTLSVLTELGTITPEDTSLAWPGVIVTANLDDDDADGEDDWLQARMGASDEDDFVEFTVESEAGFDLVLSDPSDMFRIFRDGALVLDADGEALSFDEGDAVVTLQVEAGTYLAEGSITVTDALSGDSLMVSLVAAPLIVNHHLQPSELVLSVGFNYSNYNNSDMMAVYDETLGDMFLKVSGNRYPDPWIQDEIEFATSLGPNRRLDTVIDSIRDGQWGAGEGLDDLPEDEFQGPGWAVGTWGRGYNQATSQDYFGNLEVIPPHTAYGVSYPHGRLYYGLAGSWTPNDTIREFLDSQKVQVPFTLDVSWLCVGHVDEFLTTVPDPTARLGWKMVYSDVDLAWEILEGADPETPLTRYAATTYKPWDTIGDMVADEALRELNEELKQDYLLPNLETLKTTLELTDEDIIYVPALFEEVSYCGGTTAAAFPGMVNMIVADKPDGTTTLYLPDPYVRDEADDVSTDPIAMGFANRMPSQLDIEWMDDWSVYHLNLGEVHCGSNVVRTPDTSVAWWDDARHLLEAE